MTVSTGQGGELVHRHLAPSGPGAGAPPHPTVVWLHGRGADEADLLGLAPLMPRGLLHVAVRAPVTLAYGGYAWWPDLRLDGYPTPGAFTEASERLRRFLAELPARLPADAGRVAVVGFSQGAAMAAALAVAGVGARGFAVLSGFLPAFVAPAATQATDAPRAAFVAHGTADPVVPVAAGRDARDRLAAAGVEVVYREYVGMGHAIDPREAGDLAAWLALRLGLASPGAAAAPATD